MRLQEAAIALADAADAAIAGWVVRSVERVMTAWSGAVDEATTAHAVAAGALARKEVILALRALLEADIDRQWTTPLAILRSAVRYPTEVLAAAGVPEVERDAFDAQAFPDDVYALTPATFADIDGSLAEPAVAWGACKAMEHKARHRGD